MVLGISTAPDNLPKLRSPELFARRRGADGFEIAVYVRQSHARALWKKDEPMTHAYTRQELRDMADAMADGDVLLADCWDRENFNKCHEIELTPAQWLHFIEFYSQYYGLEDLSDDLRVFIDRYGTAEQKAAFLGG